MSRLLLADGFGKSFGPKVILKSASVWASEGKVTVLFGRNGCGKSTLLKCMLGFIGYEYGTIHFCGTSYLRPRFDHLVRDGLFYLPDREFLPLRMRFGRMIDHVERARGVRPDRQAILELMGVDHLLNQSVFQLSGGETRRAEFALALLSRPRCLIADEPLMGITPKDQVTVQAAVRRIASDGCAVLVTGHEVDELLAVGDEIVWMAAGTTHGLGTPEEAARHEQFRREYLGPRDC